MYDWYLYRTYVLEIACYRNWSNVLLCSTSWFGFDNVEHFLICPIGEVYNKEEGDSIEENLPDCVRQTSIVIYTWIAPVLRANKMPRRGQ